MRYNVAIMKWHVNKLSLIIFILIMHSSDTKTEVLSIGKDQHDLCIKLGNIKLQQTKEFVYLGGIISEDSDCNKDISRRIGLASSTLCSQTTHCYMEFQGSKSLNKNCYRTVQLWNLDTEGSQQIEIASSKWPSSGRFLDYLWKTKNAMPILGRS